MGFFLLLISRLIYSYFYCFTMKSMNKKINIKLKYKSRNSVSERKNYKNLKNLKKN